MIYAPSKLNPKNIAIDPSVINRFSWKQNGSPQTAYQLLIYRNSDNFLTYDSTKVISSNSYHDLPLSSLIAGTDYKWKVQVWYNTDTATSQYEFLTCHNSPTLVFVDPIFTTPPVLSTQDYLFQTLYAQLQNISIKKYRFILYDSTGLTIIKDTGWIYGFTPEYTFVGMTRDESYQIEAQATSQDELTCTTGKQSFSIGSYPLPDTVHEITVVAENEIGAIKTSWLDLKIVTPVTTGTYSFVPGKFDLGLQLDSGSTIDYQEQVTGGNNLLSFWCKLPYGKDGDFLFFGNTFSIGYDLSTNRYYLNNNGSYTYSEYTSLYTWEDFGTNIWTPHSTYDWTNPGFNPTDFETNWMFVAIINSSRVIIKIHEEIILDFDTGIILTNTFNNTKFVGKILLDNVHENEISATLLDVNNIDLEIPQTWQDNTVFLADYENSLEAGNVINPVPIIGWRLKRKLLGEDLFTTLIDLPKTTRTYIDNTVGNNRTYIYSLHSLSIAGEGYGLEGYDTTDFFGWFLVGVANSTYFRFDMGFDGLKTDNITINRDRHVYENYSQYPVISYGKRKYKTGKITTIPYIIENNQYVIDDGVLNTVQEFLNDANPKILKNTAGEVLYVDTSDSNYKYQDDIQEQPYQISFNWTEIGDMNEARFAQISYDITDETEPIILPSNVHITTINNTTGKADSFVDTLSDAVNWDYVIKDTLGNLRMGKINACWNSNSDTVVYSENCTTDVGDTSGVSFNVDVQLSTVRLMCTTDADYTVKVYRNTI